MGVTGLWKLIDAAGKEVSLESLEGKVFAVDASILINQAIKGMKNQPNAHLYVLFLRVCKLLTYKIKPIFVFDGVAPILKRQTLAARQRRRDEASNQAEEVMLKMKRKAVQLQAVDDVLGKATSQKQHKPNPTPPENDMFALPPLPEGELAETEDDYVELPIHQMLYTGDLDLNEIDINSEGFKTLPPEYQHEILEELKEHNKHNKAHLSKQDMQCGDNFSSFQIKKLLKTNKISDQIEKLRKVMIDRMTDSAGADGSNVIQANRVLSEDATHFLLLKRDTTAKIAADTQIMEVRVPSLNQSARGSQHTEVSSTQHHTNHQRHDPPTNSAKPRRDDSMSPNALVLDTQTEQPRTVEPNVKSISPKPSTSGVVTTGSETSRSLKCGTIHEPQEHHAEVKHSAPAKSQTSTSTITNKSKSDNVVSHGQAATEVHSPSETVIPSSTVDKPDIPVAAELSTNGHSHYKPDLERKIDKPSQSITVHFGADTAVAHDDLFPSDMFTTVKAALPSQSAVIASEPLVEKEKGKKHVESSLQPDWVDLVGEDNSDLSRVHEVLDSSHKSLYGQLQQQEAASQVVTQPMIDDSIELLRLFGIPYILSPSEAEAQCAKLEQLGLCDGTITDDSDIWLFGGKNVLKNFFQHDKFVLAFASADIHRLYGLDRDKLIALALVCGSDYTDGIPGAGAVTAIEIISEFDAQDGLNALKSFKEWSDRVKDNNYLPPADGHNTTVKSKLCKFVKGIPQSFPNRVVIEAYQQPRVDNSTEAFQWSKPDLDLIRGFARSRLDWPTSKVDDLVCPVLKRMNATESQSKLGQFFNIHTTSINSSAEFQSQRLKSAINKLVNQGPTTSSTAEQSASNTKVTEKPRKSTNQRTRTTKRQEKTGSLQSENKIQRKKKSNAKKPPQTHKTATTRQGKGRLVQEEVNLSEESDDSS